MSAARAIAPVIDLQAARADRERRDQRRAAPMPRFVWVPMVVWVPVRWA